MDYMVVVDTGIKGCGTYTFEGYSQDQAKDWITRHHAASSQQPPDQFNNLQRCFNEQQVIDNIGKMTGLFMEPGNTTQLPEMSVGEQALILPQCCASAVFGRLCSLRPVFVRVHVLKHLGQFLFREVPRSGVLKEMGSLFLENQISESVQRRHRTENVGSIFKPVQIHLGLPVIGGDCKTEPHPRLDADLRIAGVIAVHKITPKHQTEVTGMV